MLCILYKGTYAFIHVNIIDFYFFELGKKNHVKLFSGVAQQSACYYECDSCHFDSLSRESIIKYIYFLAEVIRLSAALKSARQRTMPRKSCGSWATEP